MKRSHCEASRVRHAVCAVTGTRAEYGVLRNLLFRLKEHKEVALTLVVTGTHLSKQFGNTHREIAADGFTPFVKLPIPLEGDSKADMACSTGAAIAVFAKYFSKQRPELLILLGDRYEALSAAIAAHLMGIPIAHISGGDITEGAVDDAIRHCITKMSTLHFPGCEESARRIIQMGEAPARVFNVGEPGIENCLKAPLISRTELAKSLDFPQIHKDYALVTFHPVTLEEDTAVQQMTELISAMDQFANMSYVITMANADAGGRTINRIWHRESKNRSNWLLVSSLGVIRYLSAMKYAKMVIGNSSSGVIEAPVMGVPTVNIGDRQKGRMMAESIICCQPEQGAISESLGKALTDEYREKARKAVSPFGNGTASEQIADIVVKHLREGLSNRKNFYHV